LREEERQAEKELLKNQKAQDEERKVETPLLAK